MKFWPPCPNFFCQKTKHFLTAVKKQYGSINFCQKVCIYFELCHGHKKSSFDKLPEKSDTESSKSFCTISEFSFQKEHPFKKLFRVRTFLCTCSMQFSQASRDFMPAVWKIPAQKPQLIVERRILFRKYMIPQRVAAKIYKVFLTIMWIFFCPKSKKKNEKGFFSINIPSI